MKKLLSLFLALTFILSMVSVVSFSTDVTTEAAATVSWSTNGSLFTTSGSGSKVTVTPSATNTSGSGTYAVRAELLSVLKELLGDDDSVKFKISFDYTGTTTSATNTFRFYLWAETPNSGYVSECFSKNTGAGQYRHKDIDYTSVWPTLTFDGTKRSYLNTVTLTKSDIDGFGKIRLGFQQLTGVQSIVFENFTVTKVVDATPVPTATATATPVPTVAPTPNLNRVWKTNETLASMSVEGNTTTVTFLKTGSQQFRSLYIENMLDIFTDIIGEKDSAKIKISFDYKATLASGATSEPGGRFYLYGTVADTTKLPSSYFIAQSGTTYWPANRDTAWPKLTYTGGATTYTYSATQSFTKADIEKFSELKFGIWHSTNIASMEISNLTIEEVIDATPVPTATATATATPVPTPTPVPEAEWKTNEEIATKTTSGEKTIVTFIDTTKNYQPLYIDLKNELLEAIGEEESAKINITFSYKGTAVSGTTVAGGSLYLYGTVKDTSNLPSSYFVQQSGTTYWAANRDTTSAWPKLTYNGTEKTYSATQTFTKADVEKFSVLNLGLWHVTNLATMELSDVTVEAVVEATPTPTPTPTPAPTPTPVGVKFEITEDIGAGYPIWRKSPIGFTQDMADENGNINLSYVIYNTSSEDISLGFMIQNDWSPSYCNDTITIPAGQKTTWSATIVTDGNGNAVKDDATFALLSKLSFRIEIKDNSLKSAGTSFVVAAEAGDILYSLNDAILMAGDGTGATAKTNVSELPQINYEILGATVDLGATLTVNYIASLKEGYKNAVMKFTRNNNETTVSGVLLADGTYQFAYKGINPQCMGDNIKAELILDGEVLTSKDEYSVKQYAENLYNSTAAKLNISDEKFAALKVLLADMLVYGAESQKYTSYKDDQLVTSNITWAASQFTIPETAKKVVGNTAQDKVISSGINISNVYKVYFRLQIAQDVTVLLDGEDVTSDVIGNMLYTDAIKATENAKPFVLKLVKNGETISEITYSVDSYIASMYNNVKVGDIVKAISNYGNAAVAYVEAE